VLDDISSNVLLKVRTLFLMFYFFFYLNVNATIFLYYYTSTTIGFNQTMDKLTQDSLRFSYNFCDKQVYQRAILKRY